MTDDSEKPAVTMVCEKSFRVTPLKRRNLDLSALASRLANIYNITDRKSSIMVKLDEEVTVTLMSTGSALVQGAKDEEEALFVYKQFLTQASNSDDTDEWT